jgi:hypothetical protein
MIRRIEAVVDEQGNVRLLEPVKLLAAARAVVMILEDPAEAGDLDVTLLSEPSLAEDWNRPEEDEAWSHLKPGR